MITSINRSRLTDSVLAVPPLARNTDYTLNESENTKLIRHLEAGAVTTVLYGGNANFYHIPPGEYDQTLGFLAQAAAADTLIIPSVGPAFGMMMEQARVLRRHAYPTVMVLPQQGITTPEGVENGIRRFVDAAGIPALLYIKNDGYIEPENVKCLANDRIISGIKYAVMRPDPYFDPYLATLIQQVDRNMIVSGIGEQPAVVHLRDFGLGGFTSGCVCINPGLSARMLEAIRAKGWAAAERIRQTFGPLEDLRNAINPVCVLHEAVRLAGISDTGPLLPLLSNIPEKYQAAVREAALALGKAV